MTDLNQALREAMDALGRARKDIVFRHRLRQNLPRVEFDKGKLKQMLLDLFANATDATPAGGTLAVETSLASREEARTFIPQPESDLYVRLRIRAGSNVKPFPKSTASGPVFVFPFLTDAGGHLLIEPEKGEGRSFICPFPPRRCPASSVCTGAKGLNPAGLRQSSSWTTTGRSSRQRARS